MYWIQNSSKSVYLLQEMGSIPQLSVLKGPTRPLKPTLLHRIFENIANSTAANSVALIFEGTVH